ncbi:MAG TPA: DUF1992 domain-containing protein [Candidatus Kapabacteria bacterium]|nr:DUF1992 domain-containing protein [Candidatus Kapabacteria bacterium]
MENHLEAKIREARERGLFDNLKGAGRPLKLPAYDGTPEEYRIAFTMLKNAGYVPEEVAWLNQIAALKEELATLENPTERREIIGKIQTLQLKVDLFRESLR